MNPIVSIIMPIYNTEIFLGAAIRSVLSQTFSSWELLLLDDESPGEAHLIASQFIDSRIRYLVHPNSGPSFTRNRGIRESRGKYIAFLDSDDIWLPEKLEKQMEVFQSRPDVGVVFSQRDTIDQSGVLLPNGYKPQLYEGMILNQLWVDNFICMSSAIIRREAIDKIGFFDESLRMSEDFDYWLRVACKIKFAAIQESLVQYRLHGDQISKKTDLRNQVCTHVRKRFEKENGEFLSKSARHIANAYILTNQANRSHGKVSTWKVMEYYARALWCYPFLGHTWRGIARVLLPQFILSFIRNMRISSKGL